MGGVWELQEVLVITYGAVREQGEHWVDGDREMTSQVVGMALAGAGHVVLGVSRGVSSCVIMSGSSSGTSGG